MLNDFEKVCEIVMRQGNGLRIGCVLVEFVVVDCVGGHETFIDKERRGEKCVDEMWMVDVGFVQSFLCCVIIILVSRAVCLCRVVLWSVRGARYYIIPTSEHRTVLMAVD